MGVVDRDKAPQAARRGAGLKRGAVLLLALALRCVKLDAYPFWHDEVHNLLCAENLWNLLTRGHWASNHPPLPYILLRAWREVTFPLLRPALWAAVVLVFLFDFTSFGVVLLLGGPRYATLEVEIYIQAMQMLNIPLAGLLSLIQMGCTLAITALYTRLSRQQGDIPLTPRVHGNQLGHGPGAQLAVEHGSLSVDHLAFLADEDAEAGAIFGRIFILAGRAADTFLIGGVGAAFGGDRAAAGPARR